MPILKKGPLELHSTTVEDVRKEFNLDKPGKIDEAIDILYEWILKQEHFVKKDFCREYLERIIISSKGSLERAKSKVDKLCTLRTTAPQLFTKFNVKQEIPDISSWSINVYMPKLTEDNYRIHILQGTIKTKITSSIVLDVYRVIMIFLHISNRPRSRRRTRSCEYIKRNDYAKGVILIMDLRDINIMELVSEMNFVDMTATAAMYTEGFGFRIKNIFIVSESKVVHLFTSLLKRVISAKLRERVTVLRTVEDIQDNLPKELLPKDYGGHQKCLKALHDEWTEVISSEEHVEFLKEMTEACTDESLRVSDEFCNDHYGVPGTFKLLSID